MAGIDPSRVPSRSLGTRPVDRVRRKSRAIEKLHELPDGATPEVEAPTEAPRRAEPRSVVAPGADYLRPLVGMSRDRVMASLARIEHTIERLQREEAGENAEMSLARMMIAEHLRRLRIVDDANGPKGGVR